MTDTCAWCSTPASTTVNVAKGRKLQLVPVCSEHAAMVEGERAAREKERREKALERKNGIKTWW